jgi:hypothetical protein
MKRLGTGLVLAGVVAAVVAIVGSSATANGDDNGFAARLNGYQETPSISTTGRGRFQARVTGNEIRYTLTYSNLETAAQQGHIHFAQRHVAGDVIAFVCGGGDKPPCPPTSGTVQGTIDPADIIGPAAQGIEPGSFGEAVRAMRAGATYVNVHTTRFGDGEIRGQIRGGRDDDD